MDGRHFLVILKGRHWENRGKFPGKTGRATKKGGGGRARLKYRPSFYTGGVYIFFLATGMTPFLGHLVLLQQLPD